MKIFKKIQICLLGILTVISMSFVTTEAGDSEQITVCLDAGHDYKHTGAVGDYLREEEVNFKITEYCKAYLKDNSTLNVVLTHDSLECPYPDTPYEDCNYERVLQAKKDGADLYVSIHCNAESTGTSHGCHFIYPQSNWKPEFNISGLQFLESLKNNATDYFPITKAYTRDSTEDDVNNTNFYPDDTRADYYGVIRNSKYSDMLGVIIEHGFITTDADEAVLMDDTNLKELGEADAKAIIDYFVNQGEDIVKIEDNDSDIKIPVSKPKYVYEPDNKALEIKNVNSSIRMIEKYNKLMIIPKIVSS